MALSGVITLPKLAGVLTSVSAFRALLAKPGLRVYPFQLGCMVRNDGTAVSTIDTYGLGEIDANDYIMICSPVDYGDSSLFIPDTTRITRVGAGFSRAGASDDQIPVSPAVSVLEGDYILCLGPDGAVAPTATPNYDGSEVTLYTDNAGKAASGLDYLLTGRGGWYKGWCDSGREVVDLLVTDSTPGVIVVQPMVTLGAELIQ